MLFNLHVYSSWYRLQSAAIDCAASEPKCLSSSFAIDSVDSNVP